MRMTALDIQNHSFRKRFSGYDPEEVEEFRTLIVEDWAALSTEAEGLRRRVGELQTRVDEMASQENALRDALVTAQGLSDDLRRTAEREAQMRVGAAEIQAEKILAAAHRQASRLAQDVRQLRALRSRVASSVRAAIETHLALLEGFSQDGDDDFDGGEPSRLAALASSPSEIESGDLFGPPGPPATAEGSSPAGLGDAPEGLADAQAVSEAVAGSGETSAAAESAPGSGDAAREPEAPLRRPEPARPGAEPGRATAVRDARPAGASAESRPGPGWRVFFGQG